MVLVRLQIGKKGLTPEFKENLKKIFEKTDRVRVSALRSSSRDREEMKKWAEEIVGFLGKNFSVKVIGFTLVLRKWRKTKICD